MKPDEACLCFLVAGCVKVRDTAPSNPEVAARQDFAGGQQAVSFGRKGSMGATREQGNRMRPKGAKGETGQGAAMTLRAGRWTGDGFGGPLPVLPESARKRAADNPLKGVSPTYRSGRSRDSFGAVNLSLPRLAGPAAAQAG